MCDHVRDGVSGILTEPGDVDAMADAIAQLDRDDALLHTLTEGAAEAGDLCTAAAWADWLLAGEDGGWPVR
jgi:glycosyltransferase involved in cell wall biosynthesis